MKRIYEGKRPFRGGEKGYKDFLIWRTVVETLTDDNNRYDKVIFLSANTGDFARSKDETPLRLHDDLLYDLAASDRERLAFFPSLDSYSSSVIGDGFAELARLYQDIASKLLVSSMPALLNRFLARGRSDRRYMIYEAKDMQLTISHVGKLPNSLYSVSGILDFEPAWYSPDGVLVRDNNWDANVLLVVDRDLSVIKADIEGESIIVNEGPPSAEEA